MIMEKQSFQIPAGRLNYFLDIRESKIGSKYISICASKKDDQGKFQSERVVIFRQYIPAVLEAFTKLSQQIDNPQVKNAENLP
jgi:hypothetical protein